jgi:hypothetical protein
MEEKFEQISLISRLGSIREDEIASKAASNRRLDPCAPIYFILNRFAVS